MGSENKNIEIVKGFAEYFLYREKSFLRDIAKNLRETSYEKNRLWVSEQIKNGKKPGNLYFNYNKIKELEKLEEWILSNVQKNKQKDFEFHIEQFVCKAVVYDSDPNWKKAGSKEKKNEIKKYKTFIKNAKEFSLNVLEDSEEQFENPAHEIISYIINHVSDPSKHPFEKRRNFTQFRENFLKTINCLEQSILSYENSIIKKKQGNKINRKNHFISLAVVSVFDYYFPNQLKKNKEVRKNYTLI